MNRLKFDNNRCIKLTHRQTFFDAKEEVIQIKRLWWHVIFFLNVIGFSCEKWLSVIAFSYKDSFGPFQD
jgi:hypothetical protein